MFAMTRQEAQYDPSVISGLLSICSMDAYILIDPSSMHSYISYILAQYIDRMIDWLDSLLIVAMPAGGSFIADHMYRDYDIIVEGQILAANLIPIELIEFDAILGMDWLSLHGANMDCPSKEVVFHTSNGQRMCFIGERKMIPSCMIFALIVNRLIRKRCEAFLACAISIEDSGTSLANILVVCRFSKVFPEELLGLPPA